MPFAGHFNSAPQANEAVARAVRKFESLAASKKCAGSLFILLLAYMAYSSTRGISVYDEGLLCYGAERVLAGDIPYRDFWTAYGPGQYYLLAGVFKAFGASLLVARMYCVFVEWIVAILAYSLTRTLTGPIGGVMSCVMVAVWLNCDRIVLYPVIPALAFVLAGLLLWAYPSSSHVLLAGVLTGCATLVRHDLGVYAFVVQTAIIIGISFLGPTSGSEKALVGGGGRFKPFLFYLVGGSAVVLPVLLALTRAIPHRILYETFIEFPTHIYLQFRSLPFPRLHDFGLVFGLVYGLPLLILGASAILLLIRWHRRDRNVQDWLAAGLVLFGIAVYLTVRVRPDIAHMVLPMVPPLILVPWLVRLMIVSGTNRFLRVSFSIFVSMCVGLLTVVCTANNILPRLKGDAANFVPIGIDRAKGISMRKNADGFVEAVHYIQDKTLAGEPIYVGNTQHDRIWINNVMFYFLSGHRSATRFADL